MIAFTSQNVCFYNSEKIPLLIINKLQTMKFCPIFKIIPRRWILSQGNRDYKNQSVRKMTKIMTLVIFEIHKYVHLLKTLFSFSSFILHLSARHAVTLCLAKNYHLSPLTSHLICDHRWYGLQIFNFSNECKNTNLQKSHKLSSGGGLTT